MTEQISSRQNELVGQMRRLLSSARQRRQEGLFVAEGVRVAEQAFQGGAPLRALLFTQGAGEKWAARLQPLMAAAGRVAVISPAVAQALGQTQAPQGVFALFALPPARPVAGGVRGRLLLCSLQDPGNVGAILRSCAAWGVEAVLSADCPDLYSPKVLRAAAGAIFGAPVRMVADMGEEVDRLRRGGVPVYAAALSPGARPAGQVPLAGAAVAIGNEGNGLPPGLVSRCDAAVVLPIQPGCESLNAAVAAGIFAWEMARQGGHLDA